MKVLYYLGVYPPWLACLLGWLVAHRPADMANLRHEGRDEQNFVDLGPAMAMSADSSGSVKLYSRRRKCKKINQEGSYGPSCWAAQVGPHINGDRSSEDVVRLPWPIEDLWCRLVVWYASPWHIVHSPFEILTNVSEDDDSWYAVSSGSWPFTSMWLRGTSYSDRCRMCRVACDCYCGRPNLENTADR